MTTSNISDVSREKAIEIVQRAYAEGRINEPELEHRLDLILEAGSQQQLRLAVADLPAPATGTDPDAITRSRSSTCHVLQ